ncbi:hypothetical protein GQ651_02405 [Alphaproteobacteria bacterium GH1-50]|uniref:CENP-V/GFA domain-containing protein n=1 Tax=Kangsaoukella pontilimi TaxID=2691042 RepID=A0A7C9IMH1_9RHOB|nr:DUF6151 family protein [Kangsaoukella pontilimi]MXQ06690.1 hypothetical protein [Kangsaoukella pontilimi]
MTKRAQNWSCDCGAFRLTVETGGGTRAMCYCKDCQAFARALGKTAMLDAQGGSDLYQVAPQQVRIEAGAAHLRVLRLSEKGPFRWYAGCCDTPVANTWSSRALPFATMMSLRFEDPAALGPVAVQAFRRDAIGYVEREGGGMGRLYAEFGRRVLSSYLTGGWRKAPFFDGSGAPLSEPRTLDAEERSRAYDAEQTV